MFETSLPLYRGNNGSVNIIVNFGWAGSAGRLILFPMELKGPNRGTFRQSKQASSQGDEVFIVVWL